MPIKQHRSKSAKRPFREHRGAGASSPASEMFGQAVAFHSSGQIAMADHLYRQVISLDGNHAGALHWLGVLEAQSGNAGTALALLERSVAIEPNDPVAWDDLGTAQRVMGQHEQSLASYAKALAIRPAYPKALCDRGAVLHEMLRLGEAKECLELAFAHAPSDVEILLTSARVLGDLGAVSYTHLTLPTKA